jgi:uroporphyrinogen decarboxylase
MLDDAYANGEKTGYVANLGHGITQWVDPAQPKIFVDTVHEYSAKYWIIFVQYLFLPF